MAHEYRAHSIYYLLTAAMLALLLLLGWELWRTPTPGALLFVAITLGAGLWFASAFGTRIHLSPTAITLERAIGDKLPSPLNRVLPYSTQTVAYRQLIHAEESGRFLSVLTLLYYPIQPDGLLDFDHVASITLPMVTNQEQLLAHLEAVVPE